MLRSRTLRPGFFKNERLAECSAESRLLFEGLWLMADREGRLEDRPKKIKAEVFPYNDYDVDELLRELVEGGFVVRYEVDGHKLLCILNFTKHQNIHPHEAASVLPAPPLHVTTTPLHVAACQPSTSTFPSSTLPSSALPSSASAPTERSAPPAGGCPPELRTWIDWWNGLRAMTLVPCGAGSDPPSEAVLQGWARVQKSAPLRAMLLDPSKLAEEIRKAPLCREGWFRLEKLLGGKNRDGELIIRKLLEGGYRETGGKRERNGPTEQSKYRDPKAGTF